MKRVRRQSHRQALIDACRLIGYTIEPAADRFGPYLKERYRYIVLNPVGNPLRKPGSWAGDERPDYVRTFRFMWEAAMAALEQEKVNIDALKPPRKAGASYRLNRAIPREGD